MMIVWASSSASAQSQPLEAVLPQLRNGFSSWMQNASAPGLVWGVVRDGQLIHVETAGVQDIEAKRPVTAETRFRIASMSKAFTGYAVLQLRDEGKLRLNDPVRKYVPEAGRWAQDITVADLLHHTAGFVTDDPWGDRQQVLPEADFTKMLKAGVPFATTPGTRYEYSNFGYALLGRIIANVSKQDYAARMNATILRPLGMRQSGFEVRDVPRDVLAQGYRWENGAWVREPDMKHGAFSAMGGMITTANDYPKWLAHLLKGIQESQARPTRGRDMARGEGFLHRRARPGQPITECQKAQADFNAVYAAGLVAIRDCTLGQVLIHGGGYPGYGSYMMLLPDANAAVFAFSNRTYAGPSPPVWEAATRLMQAGVIAPRTRAVSERLAQAYAAAQRIWASGGVTGEQPLLAMNFLMDRAAENWATELAKLKTQAGACDTAPQIVATSAMAGSFRWTCTNGVLAGDVLLAPTDSAQIQSLTLRVVTP
jgi:serine-type D-Ala-D-Ala carboxypeptidase/endopeptidase